MSTVHDPAAFPLLEPETAPAASVPLLEDVNADFGMIPNLERVLAAAPPVLEGYVRLWSLFEQTSLSPIERQVVYQTANVENHCTYYVPWHTLLSRKAGMSPEAIAALREASPIDDARLEALRLFTRDLILHRGHPPEASWQAFLAAGYGPVAAMEVVLGLATKTISNYVNGLAHTPLDKEVKSLVWDGESR